MHEFSLVRTVVRRVEQLALARRALAVRSVTLHIGPHSAIERDTLRAAFSQAAAGGVAAAAELIIESVPMQAYCTQCRADVDVADDGHRCGRCGCHALVGADQVVLASVGLALDTEQDAHA